MKELIPFVSTHFLWTAESSPRMTQGRVYTILEWFKIERLGIACFCFLNDEGVEKNWPVVALGVEDYSFEENLKKILK